MIATFGTVGVAFSAPQLPKEYSAVIQMKMPYLSLEMPLRILTSSAMQKIEYYDGLEVDISNSRGTFKYAFNNSHRDCLFSPAESGPKLGGQSLAEIRGSAWTPLPFFPDLSQYTYKGEELVGGIMCQKFAL